MRSFRPYFSLGKCFLALAGSAILAFGLYNVHSFSNVTEGGVLGMTLLLHHWLGLSPSISGLVLNAACYIGGWRTLGRSFIFYSVIAGGAPGGDDALAMALHKMLRQPIERIYLGSDLVVLALSATYLPLERLACSLLTVLLSGQIIGLIQRIPSPSARKAAALESTNK